MINSKVKYQGMTFPVDYERKVLGELTDEEIEMYSEGVNNFRIDNDEGKWNNVFFYEGNVIRYSSWKIESYDKYTKKSLKREFVNACLKNFLIGNHLRNNSIGAPEMKAVYWGDKSFNPFSVMERLQFKKFYFFDTRRRIKKFANEERKVHSLRYMTRDTRHYLNFGLEKSGKGYFFDFDLWKTLNGVRIPQLNNNGVIV